MSPLDSRKQLLIAESEINRVQLGREWQEMAGGLRSLGHQARSVGVLTAGAAAVFAGMASFRRARSTSPEHKSSWWQSAVEGARLGMAVWSEFRKRR